MFTYSQWLSDLFKAAGHKYIKRVPYMSGGKMRYRYIYKVAHSVGGRLLLDPEHMVVGAAFQVHAESGSEVHAHIVSTSGDKVTYKLDDGPDKDKVYTTTRAELAAKLNKTHRVDEVIATERAKQAKMLADLKARGGSAKQIAREEARLAVLDTHPAEKRGGSVLFAMFEELQNNNGIVPRGVYANEPASAAALKELAVKGYISLLQLDERGRQYTVTPAGVSAYKEYIEGKLDAAQKEEASGAPEPKEEMPPVLPDPLDDYEPQESDALPPRRRLKDLGELIMGARKAMTQVELTNAEMRKNYTRPKLTQWRGLKAEADDLRADGNTPSAVVLKDLIVSSIAADPFKDLDPTVVYTSDGATVPLTVGEMYRSGVEFVMASLRDCKTEQDVMSFLFDWSQLCKTPSKSVYDVQVKGKEYTSAAAATADKRSMDAVMEYTRGRFGELVPVGLVGSTDSPPLTRKYDFLINGRERTDNIEHVLTQARAGHSVKVYANDRHGNAVRSTLVARDLSADELERMWTAQEPPEKVYKIAPGAGASKEARSIAFATLNALAGTLPSPKVPVKDSIARVKRSPLIELVGRLRHTPDTDDALRYPSATKKIIIDAFETAKAYGGKGWDDPDVQAALDTTSTKPKKPQGWRFKRASSEGAVRVGGKDVKGVTQEQLVQDAALRGTQHGNWMTRADQDAHVHNTYGAFSDLADVLGVPMHHVTANGELALAWGARGASAAAAHYEPAERVINITKTAGAGSLAHEWGHFFDHMITRLSGVDVSKDGPVVLSSEGYTSAQPYASIQHALGRGQYKDKVPANVRAALEEVYDAMHKNAAHAPTVQELTAAKDRVSDLRAQMSSIERKARRASGDELVGLKDEVRDLGAQLTQATDAYQEMRDMSDWAVFVEVHPWQDDASAKREEWHNARAAKLRASRPSRYLADSRVQAKANYWALPHEMFARAFESFVEDSLHEQGRQNAYLADRTREVHETGKLSAQTPNGEYAQIYPQGEERARINAAMRKLVDAAKSAKLFEAPRT